MRNEVAEIYVPDELLAQGFVQVPVLLLRAKGITFGAKLFYCCLLWYHHRLGYWPGRKAAAYELAVSERSIANYMKELQENGLIKVERGRQGEVQRIILRGPEEWVKDLHPEADSRVKDLHPEGARVKKTTESRKEFSVYGKNFHPTLYIDIYTRRAGAALVALARSLLQQNRTPEEVLTILQAYGASDGQAEAILEIALSPPTTAPPTPTSEERNND